MPSDFDPSFEAWDRCNKLVLSWIFNLVEATIVRSIASCDLASHAWNLLRQRFSQSDRVRTFELQQDLLSLKQDTNSVTQYFTELTTLLDEIASFRPLPDCSCPVKCNCIASRAGNLYRNEDYVMKFLSGLNEDYDVVKTQILMMEPFPNIDRVFSLVIQQERRLSPSELDETGNFVNAVDTHKFYGKGIGNPKICSFCHKPGHTADICYKRYDYPGASEDKETSAMNNIISESSSSAATDDDDRSTSKGDTDSHFTLSAKQYQALMALLQQSNVTSSPSQNQVVALTTTSSNPSDPTSGKRFLFSVRGNACKSTWILDSSATDHICSNLFCSILLFPFKTNLSVCDFQMEVLPLPPTLVVFVLTQTCLFRKSCISLTFTLI
jgi:hypothetical protein